MTPGEYISLAGLAVLLVTAGGGALWRLWSLNGTTAADLAAYKTHVAEHYVTKAGMQEQTAQLLRAIESVGSRIDSLNERLDRAFETRPSRRAT